MTEDEAKTKWCPFVRADDKDSSGRSINRWLGREHLPVGTKCVGSACMAWRWERVVNPDWSPPSQINTWPPRNPFAETNPMSVLSTTDGHCGLAGQS